MVPSDPTLFTAGTGGSDEGLVAPLAERIGAVVEPARQERRTQLDTADRRLAADGWLLESVPSVRGGVALSLRRLGDGPATRVVPAPAQPTTGTDLPAGDLRDRLGPLLAGQALEAQAATVVLVEPLTVRNRDDKAVVRLVVESVRTDDGPLGRWVRVLPVRGYDTARATVVRALLATQGLAVAGADDDLGAALERGPGAASEPAVSAATETAARAVLTALQGGLAVVEATLPRVFDDADPERLSDLRGAVRLGRSTLQPGDDVLPDDLVACFGPELGWLHQVTGPTVELDRLAAWLREQRDDASGPRRDGIDEVLVAVADQRTSARQAMVAELRSDRTAALVADWRETLDHLADDADSPGGAEAGEWGPWPPGAALPSATAARAAIIRRTEALRVQADRIDGSSSDDDVHEVHERAGALGDSYQQFGAALPDAPATAKALRRLQTALQRGDDANVHAGVLRRVAGPDGASLTADGHDAAEALAAHLDDAAAAARRQFAKRYRRLLEALATEPTEPTEPTESSEVEA